jgi:hypothetical protein
LEQFQQSPFFEAAELAAALNVVARLKLSADAVDR